MRLTVCKSQWRIIGFPFNLKIRRRIIINVQNFLTGS